MLGLPVATERKKQIPKTQLFAKIDMKYGAQSQIDNAISRLDIVNVLHSKTIRNINEGQSIKSIYVLKVELKDQYFDDSVILLLSHYIKQNIVFLLHYEDKFRLAITCDDKLIVGEYWLREEELSLRVEGLTLDRVWDSFIGQIGNIRRSQGHKTIEEQIAFNDGIQTLEKQIRALENKAKNKKYTEKERQKFHKEAVGLKKELDELRNEFR